jgi:hypothetical protein
LLTFADAGFRRCGHQLNRSVTITWQYSLLRPASIINGETLRDTFVVIDARALRRRIQLAP